MFRQAQHWKKTYELSINNSQFIIYLEWSDEYTLLYALRNNSDQPELLVECVTEFQSCNQTCISVKVNLKRTAYWREMK